MDYKKILVHVDNSEGSVKRIGAAAELAGAMGAELTGFYVIPNVQYNYLADSALAANVIDGYLDSLHEDAVQAERRFRDSAADAPVGWEQVEGELAASLSRAARYADLCVVGQHDPKDARSTPLGMVESVVLTSGQPVLVVPFIGAPNGLGQRVLVGWNASREAARAVRDAMPLIARAGKVDVVGVAEHRRDAEGVEAAVAALCRHLAAHGVDASPHVSSSGDLEPGEAVLSRAADLGSDLLVMGAYGHSRVRELVLGGATRTLLSEMTLPVLMSH